MFLKILNFSFIAFALDAFLNKFFIFSMTGIYKLQFLFLTSFIFFVFAFRVIRFEPCSTVSADCVFHRYWLFTPCMFFRCELFSVKMFYSQHYVIEFAPNVLQIYWTHLFLYYILPPKICLNRVQKNSWRVYASLKKLHNLQWQCFVTPLLVVAYKATDVFCICFHWLLVTS